jgi:phosphate-selective porin OprO/OprP
MNSRLLRSVPIVVLSVLIAPGVTAAGADEGEDLLIRNVRLIDRTGEAEDRVVNILIEGSKLDFITEDEIEPEDGVISYDGRNGVVMGHLRVGELANFLILDQDPREGIDVLLDTKTHVIFAIRDGEVVRNALAHVAAPEPEPEPEPEKKPKPRWIAYAPPPMALPLTYQDTSKWNRWSGRDVSGIFLAAMALDRQRWLSQDDESEQQVGDLKEYDGGDIRAFRLGLAGTLNFKKPWFYQVVIATHAFDRGYDAKTTDDFTWLDYRLDIPLSKQLALSVGKQKEPISMERLLLGTQLPLAERPAVLDAMFRVRNVGLTLSGRGSGGRMTWAAGVYNDWFDASQSLDESSTDFAGRVTGLAWVNENETHLLHLGFGARYTEAKEGIRYGARAEFGQSPVFVDTGALDADGAVTYDLELSWRGGPYWIGAELVRGVVSSPELGDLTFGGYHVTGSWILTREMRAYNRHNGTFGPVPVSRSVYQGGKGTWEVTARYSSIDLSDGAVQGGQMGIFSLGLNWWLTPTFGTNFNYRHIVLDRYGIRGRSNGIMYRLILVLE